MSSENPGRPGRSTLSKGRMEGFSDGVFGFASTLLVLDLAIRPPGTAWQQVLNGWPSYVAYLVSFMTIGVAWLGHTRMTDRLESVDPILLRLNLLLLFVVVLLPFPTRLASAALHDSSGERVFVTMYGITLLCVWLLGFGMDAYSRREGLYATKAAVDDVGVVGGELRRWPIIVGYVISILIGLIQPTVAVVLYLGIAVYMVIPLREILKPRRRPRATAP